MNDKRDRIRIFYAAGPGDIVGTYSHWAKGEDDPSVPDVAYSAQFYDLCRDMDLQTFVVSRNQEAKVVRNGQFVLIHRPRRILGQNAVLWHLSELLHCLRLVIDAMRFRAQVVVVAAETHWFAFGLLAMLGKCVVPSLHCALWPAAGPRGRTASILSLLDRRFFASSCFVIMSHPATLPEQIREMTAGQCRPILTFLPLYRRGRFSCISPPVFEKRPFRVLFLGRVSESKGVLDLLSIAERFKAQGITDIAFDICGVGPASERLSAEADRAGVKPCFHQHGFCAMADKLPGLLSESHVLIAPTTSRFLEGFNASIAEGVLTGRPVITSRVCPAMHVVRDAVVEVQTDDVQGYADAILELRDNAELYAEKCEATSALRKQFYDVDNSWYTALKRAVTAFEQGIDPQGTV